MSRIIEDFAEFVNPKVNYIFVTNNGFNRHFSPAERFDYVMEYAGSVGVPPSNIFLTRNNRVGLPYNASWLNQLLQTPDYDTSDSMSIFEFATQQLGENNLSKCVLFCDETFHYTNHYCAQFSHIFMFVRHNLDLSQPGTILGHPKRTTSNLPDNLTLIIMSDKESYGDQWRVV